MTGKVLIWGGTGGIGAATARALAARLTGNPQMAAAIAQLHPLPRLGTPRDMAALAAFLISDQADWITGQVIGVDGGRSRLRVKG